MNCCVKCFKDIEIKEIVTGAKTKGYCEFCKSKSLLDVYTPACDIIKQKQFVTLITHKMP